jgi:hypothetical protein
MDLAAKLQLKAGQRVESVGAPEALATTCAELGLTDVGESEAALLVLVANRSTLEEYRTRIAVAASRDRLTWVAYPKSGQLGTDLNRDSLARLLQESGVQPVRQIAIDGVWSALRFRPA